MQNVRNLLLSVGAAIAGTKLIRTVSDLEMDDVLAPLGLSRRGARVGQSLAFLGVGLLVGGTVALIFAPASGRETRQRLSKKVDALGEAAADRLREVREEIKPRLGNAHSQTAHTPTHQST